jgi:ribosomal protein S18 acetylase RimI-like enzyme
MRFTEISNKSMVSINRQVEGGALEGYVVDTSASQLPNYLESQHADKNLADALSKKFSRIGIIRNLYVDEDSRGQGIGNDLLGNAIDEAFSNGAQAILLVSDTAEENTFDLTSWYKGFGFEVIGSAGGDSIMLLDQ